MNSELNYPNARTFDGHRFTPSRNDKGVGYRFTDTTETYPLWGYGASAW